MIQAKVIEDSIAAHGKRLTTLQLVYPRFIHAEFMTHRVFSRNASSSRAIPIAKMIEQVLNSPAMPVHWGKNQPGMQAKEQVSDETATTAAANWVRAAHDAAQRAYVLMDLGIHKQVVNRILEPFQHIHVVVTASEWDNFMELRAHEDAQPEIHELAVQIRAAMTSSTPVLRLRNRQSAYNWHLPYVSAEERHARRDEPYLLAKLSTARCARVSYLTHDGAEPSIVKDLELFDRLVGARPLHASPTEHQAYPLPLSTQSSKNFFGWRQHRELIESTVLA
ncbi:hypothetical protein C0Q88_07420 [Ralstonia pickettii]|uniref:Thymidylate synthase complementing protein ThyX n=1 Tax=Ralstonia pickettii TaxID=329 RepID=A0A2N4TXT0_RALPI|nr:FAD-dependent thymidylate synthase [Ralstonia pickettii]PLC44500.1 hypothetical protein C0Q88_07420 [Ralstonia pickettii]